MENKKYFFNIDKKFLKQGYVLVDENKEVVYTAKMTKFTLLTPFKYEFTNYITNETKEHKVGHTITFSESGLIGFFSRKSSFKLDGKNIWNYLHEMGIRIDSNISTKVIGMSYTVSLKGNEIAKITMANPSGKKLIIVSDFSYDIETTEEYLDLAFLTAFAFARTEQLFYD